MRKELITLFILVALCTDSISQTAIRYGSNNGKYQEIKGVKLYYEEYGQGVPLLLIHGGLSSIAELEAIIPTFSKNFRVIAVDCPGQGRSEQAESLSYQLMADYFSTFIDRLQLDSTYVFGYSDGGNVALLLAADRPEKVKKVAAFAAASHTSAYYSWATEGLDQLTPEAVEANFQWWLKSHLQKSPQPSKWRKFISDFSAMCATPVIIPEAKLESIKTRILIVQGDNDIVRPEHSVALYQAIKGSQLCIIPAASHFILFEKPDLLAQIAMEFFNKEPNLFDWTKLGN